MNFVRSGPRRTTDGGGRFGLHLLGKFSWKDRGVGKFSFRKSEVGKIRLELEITDEVRKFFLKLES